MIDIDHIAVLRMKAGEHDDAACGGDDRRAGIGEEVDAFVHRYLPGERIDALAEPRGIERRAHRQHRRHELFLHRLLEELRFQHAQHVVLVFQLTRELDQAGAEVTERQVLRRQLRRRGAAEAGCLADAQIARAGERREPVAERVEARELRLHVAELGRHRIEVLLHEGAATFGFGFVRGEHQALQRRQWHLGGITQRDPIDRRGRGEHQQQQNGCARHEVHCGQRD